MAIKLHVGESHNVPLKVSSDNIPLNLESAVEYRSYNDLNDKPSINNVELTGNKSFSDLGLNDATTESSGLMSASDKTSLEAIKNVKGIFAVTTETTFEEISEAVSAGEYPILTYSNAGGYFDGMAIPYISTFVDTDFDPHPMWHEFGAWVLEGRIFIGFKCDNNNQWSQLNQLQLGTDVSEYSTTTEIPNAYDVYDKLIHKVSWGDVDSSVTESSDNPVSSRGIYTALPIDVYSATVAITGLALDTATITLGGGITVSDLHSSSKPSALYIKNFNAATSIDFNCLMLLNVDDYSSSTYRIDGVAYCGGGKQLTVSGTFANSATTLTGTLTDVMRKKRESISLVAADWVTGSGGGYLTQTVSLTAPLKALEDIWVSPDPADIEAFAEAKIYCYAGTVGATGSLEFRTIGTPTISADIDVNVVWM